MVLKHVYDDRGEPVLITMADKRSKTIFHYTEVHLILSFNSDANPRCGSGKPWRAMRKRYHHPYFRAPLQTRRVASLLIGYFRVVSQFVQPSLGGCAWSSRVSTATRSPKLDQPTQYIRYSNDLNSSAHSVQVNRPSHNSLPLSIPPNDFYHTAHSNYTPYH